MKKLIKVIVILALLSSFGFFGEKYQIVFPSLSSVADCAEEISVSISGLIKQIHFKEDDK